MPAPIDPDRRPVGVGVRRIPATAMTATCAGLKAAAKDWQRFSSDLQGDVDVRSYRQLPLEVDPPDHRAYRALLGPVFDRPAVLALEPRLRAVVERLVDAVVARGDADAVHDLALPMVGASIAIAFGRPGDADELTDWGLTTWEVRADGTRSGARLEAYLERVFAEAAGDDGGDVFSMLLRAELDGRRLTGEERLGIGNLVLAGGRDTVINLLSGAIWHLGRTPADRDALAADPSRIPAAVEELLRFHSPLPAIERIATADADGPWGHVEAGEVVLLAFAMANHDPAVFPDHAAIRLDRSPNPHVAFGQGPHTCIGVHLARLEARVLLETLLARVPGWRLADGAEIDWADVNGARVPERFVRLPITLERAR
ncbi:MAG TPA: cytochrome P450 [Candidatus Limnocylindrales bacterium]|nr:cytochrome P450 [Candidatus Limnocylindrales bacterium]